MKKEKHNRSFAWRIVRCFLKLFKRKPKFIFLGEGFKDQAICLSNHVGAHGPLVLELYFPKLFRFWGIHNMNEGARARFKYLSTIYFHEKKHLPKFLAFFISIFATPVMGIFYLGIRLLSTYNDPRLVKTFHKSLEVLKKGQNIIIFPENSSDGYHDVLKEYFAGFYILAKKAYEKGMDLDIYNMYINKKKRIVVVDKPIKFSELLKLNKKKEEVAEMFKERANELGSMNFNVK